jgi:PKD repeat protein
MDKTRFKHLTALLTLCMVFFSLAVVASAAPPSSNSLTVFTSIVNNDGGTKVPADVTVTVTGTSPSPSSSAGSATGTAITISTGAYSIAGSSLAGYSVSYSTECSGTINPSSPKTCTIIYNDIVPRLTVTSSVTNDNGGSATISSFPLFVDATPLTSGVQVPTTAGAHTVSDTPLAGYAETIGGDCAANGAITLALGENKTCTISHNDIPAQLTVIKHVENTHGGTADADDFTLDVSGVGPSQASVTGNEAGTPITLNVGAYSITETPLTGYGVSYSTDCSGTMALGDVRTCTVTNSDKQATLTIIKNVITDNGGTAVASDFSLSVSGTNPSQSAVTGDETGVAVLLDAGSYAVTEDTSTTYAGAYSTDCSGTVAIGEARTCTVTNDDIAPTLTVSVVVTNDNGGTATAASFTPQVDVTLVTPDAATAFNAGTHTVTFTAVPGYTITLSGDCDTNGAVTLALGDEQTCTITADDIGATLTVRKIVSNNNGGTKTVTDFTLYVDETEVTSGVAVPLSPGTYQVSEDADPQYALFIDSIESDCDADGYVTLALGENKECLMFNNDIPPTLTVNVVVINDDGGDLIPAEVLLTVDGDIVLNGEETELDLVGAHTVAAAPVVGYDTMISGDCAADGSITLDLAEQKTCTVTVNDAGATLTVTKVVINNDGGEKIISDFTFMIDGDAVESGEPNTVSVGTHYVSEVTDSGYEPTFSGDCDEAGAVTLAAGETKECIITNDDLPICTFDAFRTESQGAWGVAAHGGNLGAYLKANFDGAFSDGVQIGDGAGYSVVFTSADSIAAFLPVNGAVAPLNEDAVDPTETNAGKYAGQVLALTLNLAFDAYDADFSTNTESLGDLYVVDESSSCFGMQVDEVLAEANTVLAGEPSAYGIDGLNDCVTAINSNFAGGTENEGFLVLNPLCLPGAVHAVCGDDILNQETEECDGSAGVGEHQACSNTCTLVTVSYCGDSIVDQHEDCDGSAPEGFTCSDVCTLVQDNVPICGNEVVETGEECDTNAPEGYTCTGQCTLVVHGQSEAVCGNNIKEASEACDGTDTPENQVCSSECTIIPPPQVEDEAVCGNAVVEDGEECDSSAPEGYSCTGQCTLVQQGPPQPVCGNDIKETGEACDGIDTPAENVCSDQCTIIPPPQVPVCGNDVVEEPEMCDGSAPSGYVCIDCELIVDESGEEQEPVCGNTIVEMGEDCDSSAPEGYICTGQCVLVETGAPEAICGNNIKEATEACDGTDTPAELVCSSECTIIPPPQGPVCGNELVENGEQCDTTAPEGYTCSETCTQVAVPAATVSIKNPYPIYGGYVFLCENNFEATTFDWSFGDGDEQIDSTNEDVFHQYTTSGEYSVSCTATAGETSVVTSTTITVVAPEATVTVKEPYPINSDYVFVCENNIDATTFDWDFGDGDTQTDSENEDVFHTYAASDEYTVSCTATNGEVSVVGWTAISAVVPFSPGVNLGIEGTPVDGTYEFSCRNNYGATIYNWDFGDGTTIPAAADAVSHTYTVNGNYDVKCNPVSETYPDPTAVLAIEVTTVPVDSSEGDEETNETVEVALFSATNGGSHQRFECDRFSWLNLCPETEENSLETTREDIEEQTEEQTVDNQGNSNSEPEAVTALAPEGNFITGAFIGAFGDQPVWVYVAFGTLVTGVGAAAVFLHLRK